MALVTTYTTLFTEPGLDPLGDGPTRTNLLKGLYQKWNSVTSTGKELLETVLNQFEGQPIGGIGVFVIGTDGQHRLEVIHGLRKYPGPLIAHSPLSNRYFGYQGDVSENGFAKIVEVQDELLDVTDEINVLKLDHHKAKLENDTAAEGLVQPVPDNAPQCETLSTRKSMFIPYCLMPMLFAKSLTAREAFFTIESELTDPELRTACLPLLTYLRVGTTMAVGDSILTALPRVCPAFELTPSLQDYLYTKVALRDLQGRRPTRLAGPTDPTTVAIQESLNAILKQNLDRDQKEDDRRAKTEKATTIPEAFGEHATLRLLGICHKDNTDELPRLYSLLANKKKNADSLSILQSCIDNSMMALNIPGEIIVTPSVMQYVKTFRFHGIDPTDIASGMLPMSFVPPGAASAQGRARIAEDNERNFGYQNMMSTATQHISSADAKELAKSKGFIPTRWSEADGQLLSYQAALHCTKGGAHPLFLGYRAGWRYYQRIRITLQDALEEAVGPALAPALLVYIFQLKIRSWLEEQWKNPSERLPPPDFTRRFREDFMESQQLNWLPNVSRIPMLNRLRIVHPTPGAGGSSKGGGGGGGSAGSSGGADRGSGGGNTKLGKGKPGDNDPKEKGKRVENKELDPRYKEDNQMCTNMKEWKVEKAMRNMNGAAPKRSDGRDMCVTFRAKGHCSSNCKRRHDHASSTAEDKATFHQWCVQAYA